MARADGDDPVVRSFWALYRSVTDRMLMFMLWPLYLGWCVIGAVVQRWRGGKRGGSRI